MSRGATMSEAREIVSQYRDGPARFPQKSACSAKRGLSKCIFCGDDHPHHVGRHCESNPNRVVQIYTPAELNSASTHARASSVLEGVDLFSVAGDRTIKEWMTQDQLATFIRNYPESVGMYQKNGG